MMEQRRADKMKLGAFVHPTGNHVAAWLHPDAQIDAGTNFRHYAELARTAERGKFDLMFIADAIAVRDGNLSALRRWPQYMVFFDPLTLLAGLGAVTQNIGLVGTATTSYNEPYHVARRLASIDHITNGRAGWNVVTSANHSEAYNFGRDAHYGLEERYERAEEFVEVVKGLLDSWDDDAFLRDRESGLYFDSEKLHFLNHKGKHFSVRGPLHMARPPQGYPVLAQASASEIGMQIAAQVAEVIFTPLHEIEQAKRLYKKVKDRAQECGRSGDDVKIMPGLNPIVGKTEAEAKEKHAFLQSLIHPEVGRELLSNALEGMDLSAFSDDEPFPEEVSAEMIRRNNPRYSHMLRRNLTLREMYLEYAGARGQRTIVGTPSQICDLMESWFEESAVDGFLIQPAVLPGGLDEFIDLVVPELQERGIFRTEYEGSTLRENLGLRRPASKYVRQVKEA